MISKSSYTGCQKHLKIWKREGQATQLNRDKMCILKASQHPPNSLLVPIPSGSLPLQLKAVKSKHL